MLQLKINLKNCANLVIYSIHPTIKIVGFLPNAFVMISTQIVANVSSSMPAVTGTANTTITNITNGTYGGLQLLTVLPIVIAASGIIAGVVGGLFFLRQN